MHTSKRTIILPTMDNDGLSLAKEISQCEKELLGLSGGFTVSDATGEWLDTDGQLYSDASRVYWANLDSDTDARLLALLPSWCERLRQISLYTDKVSVSAEFVSAPILQYA